MILGEWKQYLLEQAARHPAMQPQDVYKMMFQAAFGAEHLLQDKEAAGAYFRREYAEIEPEEGPLYEQIQTDVCRVNMRAWKAHKLPEDWLFQMFVGSVAMQDISPKQTFFDYVETAKEVVEEGALPFLSELFEAYTVEYQKAEPRAVHHSEHYRAVERPAYRLVNMSYMRLLPILERMARVKEPMVIAIDGRCASGKSTMAQKLSEITGAGVVHMDDFFLPMELRTEERLNSPGGNVHYERFAEEVLPFLKRAGAFTYRRFDCSRMELGEKRLVAEAPFVIVEGSYSCHPSFGDYAAVKVFSDVAPQVQLERIGRRDGEDALEMFRERWIPMEEKYFAAYGIRDAADVIL